MNAWKRNRLLVTTNMKSVTVIIGGEKQIIGVDAMRDLGNWLREQANVMDSVDA